GSVKSTAVGPASVSSARPSKLWQRAAESLMRQREVGHHRSGMPGMEEWSNLGTLCVVGLLFSLLLYHPRSVTTPAIGQGDDDAGRLYGGQGVERVTEYPSLLGRVEGFPQGMSVRPPQKERARRTGLLRQCALNTQRYGGNALVLDRTRDQSDGPVT